MMAILFCASCPCCCSTSCRRTSAGEAISVGGAINSATGEVFHGDKIRSFNGPRFDMDAADDILNSVPKVQTLTNKCSKWGVSLLSWIQLKPSRVLLMCHPGVLSLSLISRRLVMTCSSSKKFTMLIPGRAARYKAYDRVVDPVSADDLDNILFFSVEKQKEWEEIDGPLGSFVRSTPWKHFCRKNIGYLYVCCPSWCGIRV